jgi:hypothetical protein
MKLVATVSAAVSAALTFLLAGNAPASAMGATFRAAFDRPRALDSERIAYRFKTGAATEASSLVADRNGVLYGTRGAAYGGDSCTGPQDCGSVFRLTPTPSGYTENVVYRFPGGAKGADPEAALTIDGSGVLYGTTASGGAGYGTVFKLTPNASGYAERVLYRFEGFGDGSAPEAPLLLDASGSLWGTTTGIGTGGFGTVFKLSPSPSGWRETYVFFFGSVQENGIMPSSGLVMDREGGLHGTTVAGPGLQGRGSICWPMGCGTAYVVYPSGSGYTEVAQYFFSGPDGAFPSGGLTLDGTGGCVIGTTSQGGSFGFGNVFEQCGDYVDAIYNFEGGSDGALPLAGVHMDQTISPTSAASAHELIGTTYGGGSPRCGGGCGTAFRLIGDDGVYKETVIHRFGLRPGDGTHPATGLTPVNDDLFGTTDSGGDSRACLGGCGTVFELDR